MEKSTDDHNEKIFECIFNIDMTCRSLFYSWNDIRRLKISESSVVYSDVLRYSFIQFCTILDEIDLLFRLQKDDEYLRDTIYIVEPPIDALRKFTGLKRARNLLLAHLNRGRDGKQFTPYWKNLINFKLPRTGKEVHQILFWLSTINTILVTRYKSGFDKFTDDLRPDFDKYFDLIEEQEINARVNPTPLDEMEAIVRNRLVEKGVTQLSIDPVIAEHGFFKAKFISDAELKEDPEFKRQLQRIVERMTTERKRILTPAELENLSQRIIMGFRESVDQWFKGENKV